MPTADTPEKTAKNSQRSAATQGKILGAVIGILEARGYSALSNSQILEAANVSSGALMHHFPTRTDLLAATITYGYEQLTLYRDKQLALLEPGLPQFRAIIDLAWTTVRMPEGIAVNEIRIGARSDRALAKAVAPVLSFIADDYGRFVGGLVRKAGLKSTPEMRGLSSATAMAVRSLAIDQTTYSNAQIAENILLALRTHREAIIACQLSKSLAIDPSIPGIAAPVDRDATTPT